MQKSHMLKQASPVASELIINSNVFPFECVGVYIGVNLLSHPCLSLSLRTALCICLFVSFNKQIFDMPMTDANSGTHVKTQIRLGFCLQTAVRRRFYLSVYFNLTFINPCLFNYESVKLFPPFRLSCFGLSLLGLLSPEGLSPSSK